MESFFSHACFANAFKRNIQERFESYLDTLGFIASAVKKVFSGDFKGALEDVKSAGKESIDVLTGVNNSFDKGTEAVKKVVKGTSDYVKETTKAAAANVELGKQAEIAAVKQQGIIESFDLQADAMTHARKLTEKNCKPYNVEIEKHLDGPTRVAQTKYKKSSTERDGTWEVYCLVPW